MKITLIWLIYPVNKKQFIPIAFRVCFEVWLMNKLVPDNRPNFLIIIFITKIKKNPMNIILEKKCEL